MRLIKSTLLQRLRLSIRSAVVVHDLLMVAIAWLTGFLIRYDFFISAQQWSVFSSTLPFVLVIQGWLLWKVGVYRGVWRFASLPDLWNIVRAAFIGIFAVCSVLWLIDHLQGVPRPTKILYPLLLVILLSGPRLLYRMWKDHIRSTSDKVRKTVLVLGAGYAAELLVRDMLHDNDYLPVGFLDDSKELVGAKIHGLPVLGKIDRLVEISYNMGVDVIVIAMPSASSAEMRRVVGLCEETRLPFRTLPRLLDIVSGQPVTRELREVAIDDLLGREPVCLDWQRITEGLEGKVVLVSGAGGSIGAELCRQIARLNASALVLVERCEFNLYSIDMELREQFPELRLHACLTDICDATGIDHIMATHRPEVVFHAAAFKHVPLLEEQLRETARNNVIGTKLLAIAADKYHCTSFVMISTDKAVNPSSIMGASKRIAEIFCQNLNRRSATHFITVRFGNVLGSAGSVVPLFKKQIAAGGPVTVTHPEITRFFMTIPEACQLIMQSGAMGRGGEVYVLDMGEAIGITYLAEQMITLAGKIPGEDIQIVYSGLRPGEKLHEELFHAQENLASTEHKKILLARYREVDWRFLNLVITDMEQACASYNESHLRKLFKKLVPELCDEVASSTAKPATLADNNEQNRFQRPRAGLMMSAGEIGNSS